ncbi:MAG: MBL fold metallo-hydrolase [Candidatus Aenigmarchaeota archaeon]|nr:MBL fold metallo-hydrolase [Candidatus Aenigmarchaeota archaeon]
MTKLTFFGGVNEIGGNKILLEDSGTKIFLDFGMSFTQAGKFFSEFLQPRKCNGLGDFFEFGLLPDLKGLYRRDYLKHMGRKIEDTDFQGVLLSHAHADHAAYVHHLREDIPIHCSEPTYLILKALNDTARTGFAELTELKRSFETYTNTKGTLSRKTTRFNPEIVRPRKFKKFDFGKSFKIDSLEIIPFNVDHSLPGATGFVIHTSSGTIVYTGDFRFHGRRGEKTEQFMNACKDEGVDVLIIEGTRINEEIHKKESDVESEVASYASSRGLTVCNWPIRDTDRMMSFVNAAKTVGKKLAITTKQAYLIDLLKDCKDAEVPVLGKDVQVYAMCKSWGLIGSDWDYMILTQDYEKWEKPYLDKAICYKDVRDNQKDYMFFCSNFDLKELVDLKPNQGSSYVKSVCEPFDVEMELDWTRIENWINHFGMKLHRTHVSGHASGPQLKEFVDNVSPGRIVPVHTQHADIWEKWFDGKVRAVGKVGESVEV